MYQVTINIFCAAVVAAIVTAATLGQTAQAAEPRIDELGALDRQFMAGQRQRIDELARRHLGRQLRAEKGNDLYILQALLDRRLVLPKQTTELQAMGVVMGDLLAKEFKLDWVAYHDDLGRSRALRLDDSGEVLFPITMISRRAEVGAPVNVSAIYSKAAGIAARHRPPLPYQEQGEPELFP